jgi:hypothetical protein
MKTTRHVQLLLSVFLAQWSVAGIAAATEVRKDAPDVSAEPARQVLGTLFFSPRQRLELERERKGKPLVGPDGPIEETRSVINGVATRSDGRLTVWVDGKPRWESAAGQHVANLSSADVGASAALLRSNEASPPAVPARSAAKKISKRRAKSPVK